MGTLLPTFSGKCYKWMIFFILAVASAGVLVCAWSGARGASVVRAVGGRQRAQHTTGKHYLIMVISSEKILHSLLLCKKEVKTAEQICLDFRVGNTEVQILTGDR